MKKILLSILLIVSFVNAKSSNVATKDDIKMLSEQIDKRFEMMQHNLDKRFEQIDKRFEDMNDKFNTLLTVLLFGFGLVVSIVGFYINKTYNIENEIKAVAYDVQKSHNKAYFKALVETVEKLAKKDEDFKEILKEYKLYSS